LAVKTGAVATPEVLVGAVAALVPVLANVPLAPVESAVNVTVIPVSGFDDASVTLA
jgi:hypothetical protein